MLVKCFFISILLFLVGCGTSSDKKETAQDEHQVELMISAAASLADVLEEIKNKYIEENPHVSVLMNFGPSGQLQQQIEQGAPADVFISAAQKQMNALDEKELLVTDTRVDLLQNELVLIAPVNSAIVNNFNDLTKADIKHIGIGNPNSVPAGQYAKEMLQNLKLWDELLPKLVEGQNVRTVMSFVETGNAEAGFVYRSDTFVSDKVAIVAVAPEEVATPILYPAAVMKNSKQVVEATNFIEFLQRDDIMQIFEQYGFQKVK